MKHGQEAENGSVEVNQGAQRRLEKIRRTWARCDLWPLDNAFELVFNPDPPPPGEASSWEPNESQQRGLNAMREVAMNCAGYSLRIVKTEFRPDVPCVEPLQFLAWADSRGLPVPTELRLTVTSVRDELKQRSPSRERALRPEQRHRLRCEGIAAYLWSQPETKDLTIEALIQRPELLAVGCEGIEYQPKTLRDWVKEQAPNRAPGRRPKRR